LIQKSCFQPTRAACFRRPDFHDNKIIRQNAPRMNHTTDHRRQEVQQIVKNACDQLNAEGVDARNYVEQLAWLFFLKAFDEAEERREQEAAFDDTPYERRLAGEYAWSHWARDTDHPDAMLEFVDGKLWIKLTSPDPAKGMGGDALAQRFRRIFDNVRNYCRRGVSFARVVQQVDKLHFSDATDVIVLSEIYEDLLKRVAADSAGYAGEFYTQRHVIRAMVEVVAPKPGERVYDPCFGTAGFLGEAADFVRRNNTLSGRQLDDLQHRSFYGLELKPLTYLLGSMNMILHGIEGASLELGNTLETHSQNVGEKDKYAVILSNPPYGGKMAQELQTNFRVRSGATECLFLQHIMANLARGGRAAVVVPEGVLFRGGPDQKVRKELLEQFEVHTVLSLPAGCFLPYTGVKTNVLCFNRREDGAGTRSVWFYELTNDGFELKQTRKPIPGNQIPDFLAKWRDRVEGDNSWTVPIADLAAKGYDLSAKNPNKKDDYEHRPALELVQSIRAKEERIVDLLGELEQLLEGQL
jgi:type I restriction enzyme M protein